MDIRKMLRLSTYFMILVLLTWMVNSTLTFWIHLNFTDSLTEAIRSIEFWRCVLTAMFTLLSLYFMNWVGIVTIPIPYSLLLSMYFAFLLTVSWLARSSFSLIQIKLIFIILFLVIFLGIMWHYPNSRSTVKCFIVRQMKECIEKPQARKFALDNKFGIYYLIASAAHLIFNVLYSKFYDQFHEHYFIKLIENPSDHYTRNNLACFILDWFLQLQSRLSNYFFQAGSFSQLDDYGLKITPKNPIVLSSVGATITLVLFCIFAVLWILLGSTGLSLPLTISSFGKFARIKLACCIIFSKGDFQDMALFICSGLILTLQRFTEYCILQNFYSKTHIRFANATLQLVVLLVAIIMWTAYFLHLPVAYRIDIVPCFAAYSECLLSFSISLLFLIQFTLFINGKAKIDVWIDKLIKLKSAINVAYYVIPIILVSLPYLFPRYMPLNLFEFFFIPMSLITSSRIEMILGVCSRCHENLYLEWESINVSPIESKFHRACLKLWHDSHDTPHHVPSHPISSSQRSCISPLRWRTIRTFVSQQGAPAHRLPRRATRPRRTSPQPQQQSPTRRGSGPSQGPGRPSQGNEGPSKRTRSPSPGTSGPSSAIRGPSSGIRARSQRPNSPRTTSAHSLRTRNASPTSNADSLQPRGELTKERRNRKR